MKTPTTVPSTVDAAEQAGAAEDDGGDGGQVVGRVPADGGGGEAGQGDHPGHAGQEPGEAVHLDQVPVDDAGAPGRLGVGPDRVGVAPDRVMDRVTAPTAVTTTAMITT